MTTQLTGSALVITNFAGLGWIGAFGLAVFLLLTIPIGHPFWKFEEPKRTGEFHIALEHITVVGGLMLAAILSTLPLPRSEEHTSELQSLMRISYAVFCLKKKI